MLRSGGRNNGKTNQTITPKNYYNPKRHSEGGTTEETSSKHNQDPTLSSRGHNKLERLIFKTKQVFLF
jgi:hypothetical protein